MTDNGSFFHPQCLINLLWTVSLLCSLDYLLYFLYVVPSQLKCLHITLTCLQSTTLFCGGKQNSVWGEVEWPCLYWPFFPTCTLKYLRTQIILCKYCPANVCLLLSGLEIWEWPSVLIDFLFQCTVILCNLFLNKQFLWKKIAGHLGGSVLDSGEILY